MIKNLELRRLILGFPVSLILRFAFFPFASRKGKSKYVIDYFKALISVLVHINIPLEKRFETVRLVKNAELLKRGIIKRLIFYYIFYKNLSPKKEKSINLFNIV